MVNQLNQDKNISNFYLPKKYIKQHPTNDSSYKVELYDKFICVPKKMCFWDKTQKQCLVGVGMFFTYWIYNTTDNSKYCLQGYQTIKDRAIKELHYLTVSEHCFAKEQTNNPFVSGYKNYTEASKEIIAQANKQKAEFQALIKATFSAEKMIKEQQQDWNVVLVNYTKQYKNNKSKPPEISNQELTQLLQDLSDLN